MKHENELFKASLDRMVAHLEANGVDVRESKALTLGLDIQMDPVTEQVIGNDEANARMTREYRKGFEVPAVSVKATT